MRKFVLDKISAKHVDEKRLEAAAAVLLSVVATVGVFAQLAYHIILKGTKR